MNIPIPRSLRAEVEAKKPSKGMTKTLFEKSKTEPAVQYLISTSSTFGVFYYISLVYAIYYVSWNITLPAFFSDNDEIYMGYSELYIARAVLVGFLLQVNLNYVMLWCYSSFYRGQGSELPSHASSGRYCDMCKHDVPARAAHCFMCGRCVLRRDHHCFFTGRCIGHYNQSFFVVMNSYAFFGCVYAAVIMYWYLARELHPFWTGGWYDYVYPVTCFRWLFGYISSLHFGLISLLYCTFSSALAAAGFALFELYLVSVGQTSYESKRSITAYDRGPRQNFREVFGPIPVLQFVFPLPFLRSLSDGCTYQSIKIV